MDKEKVIVIDFGGQYNQLVARRVRECNVYCEIYSYRTDIETIKAMNPKGIILTGGPNSCYEADSPTYSKELFELGIPVLGLCYGAQLMMHVLGGKVEKAPVREYGKTEVMVDKNSPLFQNVEEKTICWMSHFDYISKTAPGFEIVAHTTDCPVAAAENREKNLYAIQFHPEVLHTKEGTKMLHNFVRGVVDSPDVKLNISRETLQQNAQLRAIARRVEKKITSELQDMRDNDREAYEKFFENFGRGLKFGIYNSYGSKADELADLLLFWSVKQNKYVTLKEYVDAMPEGQDRIYYAAGESRDRIQKMPVVSSALNHGFDVLLCTQDVDEFMFQVMRTYHVDAVAGDSEHKGTDARDLTFTNVSSKDVDFATEDEKADAKKTADENKDLFSAMKEALDGKVEDVTVAAGLEDAPARVSAEGPVSLEMERVIAQGPEAGTAPKAKRVLELNAAHPVFGKLVAAEKAGDKDRLKLYGHILYDQALLVEGLPIDDPVEFASEVTKLME